jgi:hypothetical protein
MDLTMISIVADLTELLLTGRLVQAGKPRPIAGRFGPVA